MDLGWKPLWNTALTAAITLLEKMRHDSPLFEHTKWAAQTEPPAGTWVAQVSAQQKRFSIPGIMLPSDHYTMHPNKRKQTFRNYSKTVVAPLVSKGLKHVVGGPGPLPWGWLAVHVTTPSHQAAFSTWWSLRIRGLIPGWEHQRCPLCLISTTDLDNHIIHQCCRSRDEAEACDIIIEQFLDPPCDSKQLWAKLKVSSALNRQAERHGRDPPTAPHTRNNHLPLAAPHMPIVPSTDDSSGDSDTCSSLPSPLHTKGLDYHPQLTWKHKHGRV